MDPAFTPLPADAAGGAAAAKGAGDATEDDDEDDSGDDDDDDDDDEEEEGEDDAEEREEEDLDPFMRWVDEAEAAQGSGWEHCSPFTRALVASLRGHAGAREKLDPGRGPGPMNEGGPPSVLPAHLGILAGVAAQCGATTADGTGESGAAVWGGGEGWRRPGAGGRGCRCSCASATGR